MGTFNQRWEDIIQKHRPFLLAFAFRMTGSLSEAEDIVQDTFIECANVDPSTIENHKSWLTKVCSNKSIDLLRAAYKRREVYKGPWLPDAIPDSFQFWSNLSDGGSPEKNLLLAESLTTSFLLMIEKLTPEERVIYLLGEVFEYSFKDISEFLDKPEPTCRKIAQRAREAISEQAKKFKASEGAERLIEKFFSAVKNRDREAITSLLADNSEFWSDGGGKVPAAPPMLSQKEKVAKFFAWLGTTPNFTSSDYRVEFNRVNSRPGAVISKKLASGLWDFETIMTFEVEDGKISRIYVQRNPDKLKVLTRK